ncbi:hypothetical protein [Agrobacterium sp. LAD9]|uniref:hypothetical protein n=1 Tax=Agrobacterium sp. LAD9 TaxID=2055153 RepID=UPI000D1F243E|nr:hypothetical protein [Agrobacterium sp. LAD9]
MKISDCTLRDYVGSAFVNTAALDCSMLADLLDQLDLDELEVGDPFSYESDALLLRRLKLRTPVATFYGPKNPSTIRADLEKIKALGVDGVIVSIPASEKFAQIKLPSADWQYRFDLISTTLELAAEVGLYVVATGEDSPSADINYLQEYLAIVHSGGAQKFRYAESVSRSLPVQTFSRIKGLLEAVPGAQIEMHCHDMFGLALANGIAGAEAGATWISGTFLGVGERGGNINILDALAVAKFLFGDSDRDLSNISAISEKVASGLGITFPSFQRVIGRHSFSFEQLGPLNNQSAYLPFNPGDVGQNVSVVLSGKHSLGTLAYIASQAGLQHDELELQAADVSLRQTLSDTGKVVDQETAEAVIRAMLDDRKRSNHISQLKAV